MKEHREIVIAANWKMHKTASDTLSYLQQLHTLKVAAGTSIFVAVPYPYLLLATQLAEGTSLTVGAQNMHDAEKGAFTGEVSAHMLNDVGAKFVILGHSERRHVFGEQDAFINSKLHRALETGLRPILCVGETLEQRHNGDMQKILQHQLEQGLQGVSQEDFARVILAYEPVWAIGTGETATPDMAQEAHALMRKTVTELSDATTANQVTIQYGGSVKPVNAASLMAQADIDGLLIGGAALEAEGFLEIINNTHSLVSES